MQDQRNNPFASYFKVFLPSCSSDEFSGTRDKSDTTGNMVFHGRHIFSSLLRDLVAKFGIDKADNIVLVGSGSGSRGVARNCDFLASAIATVNAKAKVRCVLDGPDFVPYWITSPKCPQGELEAGEEGKKFLWGREDDESCLEKLKDNRNSTELAKDCGIYSRYWKHVSTPMFVISSQFDPDSFEKFTCGVTSRDENYSDFTVGWRQGMLALAEAMSVSKPGNGWFIPNCAKTPLLLDDQFANERRRIKIAQFDGVEEMNVLQTLNNWLKIGEKHQAIDAFGIPNEACNEAKSLPLDLRPETIFRNAGETGEQVQDHAKPYTRRGNYRQHFLKGERFLPPSDLFPPNYNYQETTPDSARISPNVDELFDYDDLNLGLDFDFATRHGGIALPEVDSFRFGTPGVKRPPVVARGPPLVRVPTVARGPPVVVTPVVVEEPVPVRKVVTQVVHSPSTKASLWKKLYYLEYLRWTYEKHYKDYYHEYYGAGTPVQHFARIQEAKSIREKDEQANGDEKSYVTTDQVHAEAVPIKLTKKD